MTPFAMPAEAAPDLTCSTPRILDYGHPTILAEPEFTAIYAPYDDIPNAALNYARKGWHVFPCDPRTKRPLTGHGFKDATTDLEQVALWWQQWPNAMIGCPTGSATGVFALDPDVAEKPGEADGLACWRSLLDEHGEIAPTRTHRSPSGGMHILFQWDAVRPITNKEGHLRGKGINVRGEGGYVILPPSQRADGVAYQLDDPSLEDVIAPAPPWLLDLIDPPKAENAPSISERAQAYVQPAAKISFTGHAYAAAALQGEARAVATAAPGGRNEQLNESAFKLGTLVASGALNKGEVKDALLHAARTSGLIQDDGELSAIKTIQSGLGAGALHPREIPTPKRRTATFDPTSEATSNGAKLVDGAMEISGVLTQDDMAMAFARQYEGRLRYCHDTGAWFKWAETHWQRDTTQVVFQFVRETGRAFTEGGKARDLREVRRVNFASGTERFCQSDPAFAVNGSRWNADPWLLGTPGGTVDLKTGKLRPAQPAEGITKLTAVAPADIVDCPLWLRFVGEATKGDTAFARFLQQWCGYCLTGVTIEHALLFVCGNGGNGKGVFLNVVQSLLKDYAVTATMDTFTASKHERHSTELAMLHGARLVTASETEEGRPWAEARIKNITGGDPITARFMRQDNFTFTPAFKLTIIGNHKPVLHSVDDAVRRRFNIAPFVHKPEAPDKDLEAKLRVEFPGVLRWMIKGCLDWQANGLVRSANVLEETSDYFDDQDVMGQWISECCAVDQGNDHRHDRISDLFQSFKLFAEKPAILVALLDRLRLPW